MRNLDILVYTFGMVDNGAVLILLVYFIITLSDLECDYLNSHQCCDKLNWWTPWHVGAQALVCTVLLLTGHWLLFACNLPMLLWMLYRYYRKPPGSLGMYDPTEIHNSGQLYRHNKHVMINIVFYLAFFFTYLYLFILTLLKADDKPPPPVYEARHL